MPRFFSKIFIFILILLIFSFPALGTELSELDFFREHPALLNLSELKFEVDKSVKKPSRTRLGAFGIGGLNAFTVLGLCYPFNTFHNTTTYYFPFFGDSQAAVEIDGKPVDFPKDAIWYVRRASIAVTKEENESLALATVNFSPPNSGALVRVAILKAAADLNDVFLFADIFGDKDAAGSELVQTRGDGNTKRTLYIGSLDGAAIIDSGRIGIRIPSLKKNEEKVFYFYYIIQGGRDTKASVLDRLKNDKQKLVSKTVDYWSDYLKDSATFTTPDARFNDMLDGMKIALKIQRNENGGQTPTVKYADRVHDRENIYINRFYLMAGMPRDAEDIMMFGYRAAAKAGVIQNSRPADMDLSGAPENPDWEHMPLDDFESEYFVAERPSWTVIQFCWLYKYTNDLELMKKVYPYLRRNLTGQNITPEGLMPFHGDDMGQITIPTYVTSGIRLPAMYSFESSLAFAAAAKGLAEIAVKLGKSDDAKLFDEMRAKVEAAIFKYYWNDKGYFHIALRKDNLAPVADLFALIGLQPAWLDYDLGADKMEKNFMTNADRLGQSDGSIKMAARATIYHGQTQGLYLYNLKYFNDPRAERLFHLLIDKISDPAGQFSEAQQAGTHSHISFSVDQTGKGKEDARRFGPWEGGENAAALIYYLTGMDADAAAMKLTLSPEIPKGWDKWQLTGGRIGANTYDISVADSGSELIYTFINRGPSPVELDLSLPIGARKPQSVLIDGQQIPIDKLKLVTASGRTVIKNIPEEVEKKIQVMIPYE